MLRPPGAAHTASDRDQLALQVEAWPSESLRRRLAPRAPGPACAAAAAGGRTDLQGFNAPFRVVAPAGRPASPDGRRRPSQMGLQRACVTQRLRLGPGRAHYGGLPSFSQPILNPSPPILMLPSPSQPEPGPGPRAGPAADSGRGYKVPQSGQSLLGAVARREL